MSNVVRSKLILVVFAAVVLAAQAGYATTWDMEAQFSLNQSGPWNYQRATAGVYDNLTVTVTDQWVTGFNGWSYPPESGYPWILQNQTASDITLPWGSAPIKPGQIGIDSNPWKDISAVISWTAPADGVYHVYGVFGWLNQGSRRVKILHLPAGGGGPLTLLDYVSPAQDWPDKVYEADVFLSANDKIAYVGMPGGIFTRVQGVITVVPEPSALVMLGSALAGLAGFATRRRRS